MNVPAREAWRLRVDSLQTRLRNRYFEETRSRGFGGAYAFVSEYPKSGGTWVKNLLVDVAALDESGRKGPVIHNHWAHDSSLRPAVCVVRDGRDVVVSFYFHHLRYMRPPFSSRRIRSFVAEHFSAPDRPDDIRLNLPSFIRTLRDHPLGGLPSAHRQDRFPSWPDHVADWWRQADVTQVRYETLLADTTHELSRVVAGMGADVEQHRLSAICEANSFRAASGREPGNEDRTSFLRKGVAGDWRNHFTAEAGAAFVEFAGETLRHLGYETTDEWVDELPRM